MQLKFNLNNIVEEASELLPRIMSHIVRNDQYCCKGLELTVSQLRLLKIVQGKGEIGMNELSKLLSVAPPSVTITAERLVQQGLLSRSALKEDRRVVLVSLTSKAKSLMQKFIDARKQHWHEILSPLHENDREILASTLRHLLGLLEKSEKKRQAHHN